MTVRELIQRLGGAPPDSEIFIVNPDGTTRPVTQVAFRNEDGTEMEIGARNPVIHIVVPG